MPIRTEQAAQQQMTEFEDMAEHFFGYGRWEAPFWFIGPEAGMGKTGDSLEARYQSWRNLGRNPVIDCEKHHQGFKFIKWHQPNAPTQPTWRQLIRLLLTYKGIDPSTEKIREYQRDHWGRESDETCAIELSGIPAPNMRERRDRSTFLSRRINRIRCEIRKHKPHFIVMYGLGQRRQWEKVAGAEFDSSDMCRLEKTIAAIAPHPVSRGVGNDYWAELGRSLKEAGTLSR